MEVFHYEETHCIRTFPGIMPGTYPVSYTHLDVYKRQGVRTVTSFRTSFISPPYAPAFITTAPPKVPGIPPANSKPVSDASLAAAAIPDKRLSLIHI